MLLKSVMNCVGQHIMSDYTPTTDEIRNGYTPDMMIASERPYEEWKQIAFDEFDRWLSAHDAAIRSNERERFVDAFVEHYSHSCDHWTVKECRDSVVAAHREDEK